jgi:hypothetical protein
MRGWCWFLLLAACLHVAEESCFGWVAWVRRFVAGVTVAQFVFINVPFLLVMAAGAWFAPQARLFALSTAALLFVNAWFHIGPSLATRTYSPGLATAIGLYLPLPILTYTQSIRLQGTNAREVLLTLFWGAAWMVLPLLFQGIRLAWDRLRPIRQVAP